MVTDRSALDFTGADSPKAILDSRATIGQADGELAGRYGTATDHALTRLRNHPGNAGRPLADAAREIVTSATAGIRPRHGTSRVDSTREQREE